MSPEEDGHDRRRGEPSSTELAVELTIAWLKRVESTADGRDPKEVVEAMTDFFNAIVDNRQKELAGQREPAAVS